MAEDYVVARRKAKKEKKVLVSLEELVPNYKKLKQEPLGVFEVPMYLVRGTATHSRASSFSGGFLPLLSPDSEFAGKWKRLLAYQKSEGINDPVLVYEYLGEFYVVEGNKRVSVLRYLEQPELTADVVRLLPEGLGERERLRYEEFRKFFRCTGLFEPYLSKDGNYPLLAKLLDKPLERPWAEEDVRCLESAVYRFCKLCDESESTRDRILPGDLYLHYLCRYPTDPWAEVPDRKLKWRVFRILRKY